MVCPKCKGDNVNTQIINETYLKNKHHGLIWWLFVGWWWVPIKWMVFTIPALICAIFFRRKKVVNKQKTMCVCQTCGHSWQL